MTTEQIDFGSERPDGETDEDTSPAVAPQTGGVPSWQAPAVLLLALVVLLGAVGAGVALGRTDKTAQTPYAAWAALMSALSDPEAPAANATPAQVVDAIGGYADTIRERSEDFEFALETDDGPYSFPGFPADAPTRESLQAVQEGASAYVDEIDDALDAVDDCLDDGTAIETCVATNLQTDTRDLQAAAATLETAYRAVVAQSTSAP